MTPKGKGQYANRNPGSALVVSTFPKKQKKERAGQKDRTAKRIKPEIGKSRNIAEAFEQHFVDVPRNCMKGKKSVLVPRFLKDLWDMTVPKVEDGVKARDIVRGG